MQEMTDDNDDCEIFYPKRILVELRLQGKTEYVDATGRLWYLTWDEGRKSYEGVGFAAQKETEEVLAELARRDLNKKLKDRQWEPVRSCTLAYSLEVEVK
jgi:hypothetical protein